jgi:hypothetical protein
MVKKLPKILHNAEKMFNYLLLNVPKLIFSQKCKQKLAGKSFKKLET